MRPRSRTQRQHSAQGPRRRGSRPAAPCAPAPGHWRLPLRLRQRSNQEMLQRPHARADAACSLQSAAVPASRRRPRRLRACCSSPVGAEAEAMGVWRVQLSRMAQKPRRRPQAVPRHQQQHGVGTSAAARAPTRPACDDRGSQRRRAAAAPRRRRGEAAVMHICADGGPSGRASACGRAVESQPALAKLSKQQQHASVSLAARQTLSGCWRCLRRQTQPAVRSRRRSHWRREQRERASARWAIRCKAALAACSLRPTTYSAVPHESPCAPPMRSALAAPAAGMAVPKLRLASRTSRRRRARRC